MGFICIVLYVVSSGQISKLEGLKSGKDLPEISGREAKHFCVCVCQTVKMLKEVFKPDKH